MSLSDDEYSKMSLSDDEYSKMSLSDDEYSFDYVVDDQEYDYSDVDDSPGSDNCDLLPDNLEFSMLSSEEIKARVYKDIADITSLLSVSNEAAVVLLCKFGWDVCRIHEEWFSDEVKTRQACGLTVPSDSSGGEQTGVKGKFFCGICLQKYKLDSLNNSAVKSNCGHVYCKTCWRTYISTAIDDGPGSLLLRCPEPSCGASVADMIGSLASDKNRARYENHVLRSYIEGMKNLKYCPAPGCEFAVECLARDFSNCNNRNFEVTCNCSYRFCWNCLEESHSPIDCETVTKWALKNCSESENTNWILVNTKACPKCHKRIEKNQGCNHMSCAAPCGFEFCWMCLSPLKNQYHCNCNQYEEAKKDGMGSEEEKIREMAKRSLDKYVHHFERYMGNHNSRKRALVDIEELPYKHLEKLRDIHYLTMSQLQFIKDAWVQIVECRRVLKWSYAYGYYIPENEQAKKKLFEYLQGQAEFNLERLHSLVEKELPSHSNKKVPPTEFVSYSAKVVDLTKITRGYFQNFARALANGLSDVNSITPDNNHKLIKATSVGKRRFTVI